MSTENNISYSDLTKLSEDIFKHLHGLDEHFVSFLLNVIKNEKYDTVPEEDKERVEEIVSILSDRVFQQKFFRLFELSKNPNPTTMTIQDAVNFVNSHH